MHITDTHDSKMIIGKKLIKHNKNNNVHISQKQNAEIFVLPSIVLPFIFRILNFPMAARCCSMVVIFSQSVIVVLQMVFSNGFSNGLLQMVYYTGRGSTIYEPLFVSEHVINVLMSMTTISVMTNDLVWCRIWLCGCVLVKK